MHINEEIKWNSLVKLKYCMRDKIMLNLSPILHRILLAQIILVELMQILLVMLNGVLYSKCWPKIKINTFNSI